MVGTQGLDDNFFGPVELVHQQPVPERPGVNHRDAQGAGGVVAAVGCLPVFPIFYACPVAAVSGAGLSCSSTPGAELRLQRSARWQRRSGLTTLSWGSR